MGGDGVLVFSAEATVIGGGHEGLARMLIFAQRQTIAAQAIAEGGDLDGQAVVQHAVGAAFGLQVITEARRLGLDDQGIAIDPQL